MLNKRDKDSLKLRGHTLFFKSMLLPYRPIIIDRYLFIEFLKSCFGAIIFFAFIFEMTQLFYQMNMYLSRKGEFNTTERILIIHLCKLPWDVILFSPLGFLFGTMFTLSSFYKNNEAVTVIGSGVHLFRFTLPILAFSFVYSIFLIFFGEYVMAPLYNKSETTLWEMNKQQKKPEFSQGMPNLKTSGEGGLTYNIGYYDPSSSLMRDGVLITRNTTDVMGVKIARNTENKDKIEKKDVVEIAENIVSNSEILSKSSKTNTNNTSGNTIRNSLDELTNTETQEIDLKKLFKQEISTKPNEIFIKDNISKDLKPEVSFDFFSKKEPENNIKNNEQDKPTSAKTENVGDTKTNSKIKEPESNNTDSKIKEPEENNKSKTTTDKKESFDNKTNNLTSIGKDNKDKTYSTITSSNENAEKKLETNFSISEKREEYNIRANYIIENAKGENSDYDGDKYLKNNAYLNQSTTKGKEENNINSDIINLQNETSKNVVNAILDNSFLNSSYSYNETLTSNNDKTTSEKEPINNNDKSSRTSDKNVSNDEGKTISEIKESINPQSKKNETTSGKESSNDNKSSKVTNDNNIVNDKGKTIGEIKESVNPKNNKNQESYEKINTEDLENVEFGNPDIEKIKNIANETYLEKEGNKESITSSTSIGVPIGMETDNNVNINIDASSSTTYKKNEPQTDINPVTYFPPITDLDFDFDSEGYTDNNEKRTIDLRLDAECLIYDKDGWYSKCKDKSGNFIDARAELWEWDENGNLLFGYPKNLSGQKINFIVDQPFHFEDDTNTKMETISFGKGLRIIDKLKKSAKVYKSKESELFGRKLYFPFASFIITFLGIGLGRFHSKKGMLISSFFKSLLFFAGYYVIYQAGESVGALSTVPIPGYFAPALGNIIFILIGSYVISKSKT